MVSYWLGCCWAKRKSFFLLWYVKWVARSGTCLKVTPLGLSDSIWFCFLFVCFYFWLHHAACRILVPQAGTEPMSPAVETQSLNHWTTREVLSDSILNEVFLYSFSQDILNFWSILPIIKAQELENKLLLMCCCLAGTHSPLIVNKKFLLETHTKIFKIEYKIVLKHYARVSRHLLNWRNQAKSQ